MGSIANDGLKGGEEENDSSYRTVYVITYYLQTKMDIVSV